ncbi:Bifunctional transcriptional activator/DNA repair enzyme AdaA [compost metagenome]
MLFQPYQLHRVEVPVHADTSYIRTNLTFNPHLVEPWLEPFPGLRFFFRTLWRGVLPQQVFHLQNDERLANLLDEFQWLHPQPSDTREEDLGLFFLTLLRYLDLHVFGPGRTNAVPSRSTLHVEKIMDWAEEHFREPFHLQRLADELHLSPYHLSHLFKQCTGRTVSDYIAARRIREACSLLMLTAMPVKAIGQEVGGFSTAYFCQLFKKWKGITPQAYRETVRTLY